MLFTAVGALLVGYVVWICVKMAMHAFVGGTALICVAAIGAAGLMVAIAAMTARRA